MFKVRYLIFILFLAVAFSACQKKDSYDPAKQLAIDEAIIKDFAAKNNLVLTRKDPGVYYQIIEQGTGAQVSPTSKVTVNYEGKLLNGNVFDESAKLVNGSFDSTTGNPVSFTLNSVIQGWQIGVPIIQKGGIIRLIIPSVFAYQNINMGKIPANSVLDFTIELKDVQ